MTVNKVMEVNRIIYQFWTGKNKISENRLKGIQSMKNINIQSVLLYHDDIMNKILPNYPLHPIYQYLSENHKSDYLRCYFMHHFGGGYADIKVYSANNNWAECFNMINNHPEYEVIGQAEFAAGTFPEYRSRGILNKLVANGYFIVRPYSNFSTRWWNAVNAKLDEKFEIVKRYPAEFPRDGIGSNKTSKYPMRWAEVQGEIFHRICYEMRSTPAVQPRLITGRTLEPYL